MRIAAAVLLMLIGLWSLVGGGMQAVAGVSVLATPPGELRYMMGWLPAGLVGFVGGLLCLSSGIAFCLDRGKLLGLVAIGVALCSEAMFLPGMLFSPTAVLKILLLGFCAFGAAEVGARRAAAKG